MATGVMAGLLLGVGTLVPVAVNQTACRNILLNRALKEHGLTATAARSSGGWFAPFKFQDVVLSDTSGRMTCQIESLQSTQSLLSHFLSEEASSVITLVHPQIDITLDDQDSDSPDNAAKTSPQDFAFHIQNGELTVRVPWRELPIVELDRLSIQGKVAQEQTGRWLTIDGTDILTQAQLSDRHTEQNLALVAPLVSQTTAVSGTVSAQLNPIRIRLDKEVSAEDVLLSGSLQIHSLKAELRPKWSQAIVTLVKQLSSAAVPDQVQLVSQSEIDFFVTSEGIHHRGFSLLLPDIATGITMDTSGVVRLDEQLDLSLNIQIPMDKSADRSFLNRLAGVLQAPIQLQVSGTVSNPRLVTPGERTLTEEFTQRLAPALHVENSEALTGAVRSIIQAGATQNDSDRVRQLPGRIYGLIQAIKAEKLRRSSEPEDRPVDE